MRVVVYGMGRRSFTSIHEHESWNRSSGTQLEPQMIDSFVRFGTITCDVSTSPSNAWTNRAQSSRAFSCSLNGRLPLKRGHCRLHLRVSQPGRHKQSCCSYYFKHQYCDQSPENLQYSSFQSILCLLGILIVGQYRYCSITKFKIRQAAQRTRKPAEGNSAFVSKGY